MSGFVLGSTLPLNQVEALTHKVANVKVPLRMGLP